MVAPSACKAGKYDGLFTGSYSSGLVAGIPLSVTGNVDLTLNQAGTPMMTCVVRGEGFESCSDVFPVSGGSVTGVANQLGMIGDANIGGFPYYCTVTGTLDCAKKVLVDGWIQCTYCVGPLGDGGASCTLGIGGHFAGPVTASYDTSNHAFVDGSWNGAAALAVTMARCLGRRWSHFRLPGVGRRVWFLRQIWRKRPLGRRPPAIAHNNVGRVVAFNSRRGQRSQKKKTTANK